MRVGAYTQRAGGTMGGGQVGSQALEAPEKLICFLSKSWSQSRLKLARFEKVE